MRFTIKREEFLKGLNIANRAVSSKIAMPVLENLRLDLTDRGLFITGSNLDISIKTQVPYKLGEEEIIRNYKEGSILMKARLLVKSLERWIQKKSLLMSLIPQLPLLAIIVQNIA